MKYKNTLTYVFSTVVALMMFVVPVFASSSTISAQGGRWNYGVGSKYVWSYYSHNHKTHKASVEGKYYVSSGWTKKGITAKASCEKRLFGNRSYYEVK